MRGAQTGIHQKGIEGSDLLHQSLPPVFHKFQFIQWLCNLNIIAVNIMGTRSSIFHHLENISLGLKVFKVFWVLGMRTEWQTVPHILMAVLIWRTEYSH